MKCVVFCINQLLPMVHKGGLNKRVKKNPLLQSFSYVYQQELFMLQARAFFYM